MSVAGNGTRRRPVAVVLVDAEDRGLARPQCSNAALCQVIYDEICQEESRAKARAPWRLLGVGEPPAEQRKKALSDKVSSTMRAVLAGERPPPSNVPRVIDAISRELTALAKETYANIACQLFVPGSAAQTNETVAVVPALFGGVPPMRLAEHWDAASKGNIEPATPPPTFSQVCAGGFIGASAVLVISSRMLVTLQPLTAQLTEGENELPMVSWIHCAAIDPAQLEDVSKVCASYGGGKASSALSDADIRESLRVAFGLPPTEPKVESPRRTEMELAAPNDNAAANSALDSVQEHSDPVDSADKTFDVVWKNPGPLGLDFYPDSWVIAGSSRPEVCHGDLLLYVGGFSSTIVTASGTGAASVDTVTAALQAERRPLILTFTRDRTFISEILSEARGRQSGSEDGRFFGFAVPKALKKFAPPTRPLTDLLSSTRPLTELLPPTLPLADLLPPTLFAGRGEGNQATNVILRKHVEELQTLDPESRRARIRELVANEVRRSRGLAAISAGAHIARALDAEREPNQRVLIEWLLVMCRALSFTGDVKTLCRASLCCRRWRSSLSADGSDLALSLWKWAIRFGEPVSKRSRWAFWRWLLGGGGRKLRRPRGPVTRPPSSANSGALTLAKRDAPGYFAQQLDRAQSDDALGDARTSIMSGLAHVFSGSEETGTDQERQLSASPVFQDLMQGRQESLERILLAIAAERSSFSYCQGLAVVVAFALSVAEEAGITQEALEADVFAVVASLLDSECVASWMEPSLSGVRTAASAIGLLLEEKRPQLVAHLRSEGGGNDLFGVTWLQTMFVSFVPMSRATLCRIWDCWLLDATPKVLFRVSLWLLEEAEPFLMSKPLERIVQVLQTYPTPLDVALQSERLLAGAWASKVTNSILRKALSTATLSMKATEDSSGGLLLSDLDEN